MNEEILKLAKKCGITEARLTLHGIQIEAVALEAFYKAAFNAGIEAAAKACVVNNNREYEELRAIIDNGSESMTHEDAVKELRRLMRSDELESADPFCYLKQTSSDANPPH